MDLMVLKAEARKETGSRAARRLRAQGKAPAVLYGHGEEVALLTLEEEALKEVISREAHAVMLEIGGQQQRALIRDVQHDTWGQRLLHADFTRVAKGDRVVVAVKVELHGVPKAVATGAMLEQPLMNVNLDCDADAIPGHLVVEVEGMEIGQMIHASDLRLPEGVTLKTDPHAVVAVLLAPKAEEAAPVAAAEGEAAAAEPELIRKEKEEEDEEGEEKEKKK
ncbi:MAG TPA: 50S ribosomal protein L25 [Candidatus Brocadiia bacterium]|nr:50S ribosomal protein L25 [Candidatus Brocadiia bacterium]